MKKPSFEGFFICLDQVLRADLADLFDQTGFGAGSGILFHDTFLRGFIDRFDSGQNGFLPFFVLGCGEALGGLQKVGDIFVGLEVAGAQLNGFAQSFFGVF